jgi:hypothetical protein
MNGSIGVVRRSTLLVTCLLLATLAVPRIAPASERTELEKSGDWTILVDAETGNGCLMRREQADGLVVELGAWPARKGAFFAAFHPDWTDLPIGETVRLEFHFDDVGFAGDAIGTEREGLQGGIAYFNNLAFIDEFAKRSSVKVVGPKGGTAKVDLTGTSRAIAAVKECQSKQPAPE